MSDDEKVPTPVDGAGADHLLGLVIPSIRLAGTNNDEIDLGQVDGRWVLFVYPGTGVPGQPLPEGWNDVPGAGGCTGEVCGFRDHRSELADAGVDALYGVSVQSGAAQQEAAERLDLPYPLLSDGALELAGSMGLPVFGLGGATYYRRLTLIIRNRVVERVFYPVHSADSHARAIVEWLYKYG